MRYTTTMNSQEASERKQFTLVPGYYSLTAITCEDKQSKAGNDMSVVTFLHQESQEKLSYYLLYGEKTVWKIERFIAALGVKFDKFLAIDINDQLCRGRSLTALIGYEHGSNEGVKFPRIIDVFNPQLSSAPLVGAIPPEQYEMHRLTKDGYDPYSKPKVPQQQAAQGGGGYQSSYGGGGYQQRSNSGGGYNQGGSGGSGWGAQGSYQADSGEDIPF